MNPLVSKLSIAESDQKTLRSEELFFNGIQSYYQIAKSLMSKVDEIENEDRKLILVADDEPLTFDLIEEFLAQAEIKCDVITAANGARAYDLARSFVPDLIITDWLMPEMDGPELITKLKSDQETREIPIILMTGFLPSSDELDEVLDAGATDYLRKPLDYTELKARVKTALALNEAIKEIRNLTESRSD